MHLPPRRLPDDGVVRIDYIKEFLRCSSFFHQLVFAGPTQNSKQNFLR
jgi:hypothetical protein